MFDASWQHRLSSINRFVILLTIVIVCGYLYYSLRGIKELSIHSKYLCAPSINSQQTIHEKCHLSLKESDGWFCESDDEWIRRKHIHHRQDKINRNDDSFDGCFANNWEPTIQCAFERRVGEVGDGAKWVCDIHHLRTNNSKPLIYSLGSNGDFSFERAVKQDVPNAEIHTFDQGIFPCPFNICSFHQARFGAAKSNDTKSLLEVIYKLGHAQRPIDILKADVEGSEYTLFEEFFNGSTVVNSGITSRENQTEIPYIRQILVEIHVDPSLNAPCRRVHRLFEIFRNNNYAIFHKEANLGYAKKWFEYALIRLNPAFFNVSSY